MQRKAASISHIARVGKAAAQTIALAVVLLLIAGLTRVVALQFPANYALHAALCAPLFAVTFALFLRRGGAWNRIPAALALVACALGTMRPIEMGAPFACAALLAFETGNASRKNAKTGKLAVPVASTALLHPLTVMAGLANGSCAMSFAASATSLLSAALASALCMLASVALQNSEHIEK